MGDAYGRKVALCPSDTNEVQLFSCPAGTQVQGILSVMNLTDEVQTYSIAHCAAGHGDNPGNQEDFYRANAVQIYPGAPPHEYSVNMAATETIRIRSGNPSALAFGLEGLTIT